MKEQTCVCWQTLSSFLLNRLRHYKVFCVCLCALILLTFHPGPNHFWRSPLLCSTRWTVSCLDSLTKLVLKIPFSFSFPDNTLISWPSIYPAAQRAATLSDLWIPTVCRQGFLPHILTGGLPTIMCVHQQDNTKGWGGSTHVSSVRRSDWLLFTERPVSANKNPTS